MKDLGQCHGLMVTSDKNKAGSEITKKLIRNINLVELFSQLGGPVRQAQMTNDFKKS